MTGPPAVETWETDGPDGTDGPGGSGDAARKRGGRAPRRGARHGAGAAAREAARSEGETERRERGYAAARLRLLQKEGQPGQRRRRALAELTDRWLAGLVGKNAPPGIALVAVGGYGRGELSPRSDLDLLLLHDGRAAAEVVAGIADRVWYPVWDLGLALDHSVRDLAEVRTTAGTDLKVQLGLLEARHIAGDSALTAQMRAGALAQWRAHARERLPELRELAEERARRHGELRFLLEPDLKEARGGLRDITALRAVAASWLADAPREGLEEARTTLLDVRDTLHLSTGRATDRLGLQDQDQVAEGLGLADADALLRRVYEAAGTIAYAGDVTWREVGRVLRPRSGGARAARLRRAPGGVRSAGAGTGARAGASAGERTPLAESVVEHDGEASLALNARPERDPVLPLRAAAAAAQAGLPLALPAVRKMARTVPGLPLPWPAQAREEFVTLLGAGEATVPVWEALEAGGLISRLLPDWERVRCRPQRNPVHLYTVDRHLVETAVRASALTRRVHRPDLLLVAALLHDIGKGWPGDHSVVGETIARDMAARIGFGGADTEVLATLVRHHLLLVETATRRDLDDPATVSSVATAVGGRGTLELLHALTEADARATGPAAWSSWRAALVAGLVARVDAVLAGEPAERRAEPRELTAEGKRAVMEAHRTGGPVLRLRAHTGPDGAVVAPDAGLVGRAPEGVPSGGGAEPEPEQVGAELMVALRDRPGVLPTVAGVLALHRLTVRSAELRLAELPPGARQGGSEGRMLLLTWRVAAGFGALPQEARLRADLVRALDGSLDIASRLAEREAAYQGSRRRGAPAPRATLAPEGSRAATVIEVRAQDAPGLLYRLGHVLEASGVRVRSAHVSTLGANAVDAFYVTDAEGAPLPGTEAARLAERLEAELRR